MTDSTDEREAPAAEVVAVSDEPEHEDQPEVVVEAVEPEENVAEAVTSEDDADAAVPFYKRELSFRRKKAEVEAVDQPELEAQADETDRGRGARRRAGRGRARVRGRGFGERSEPEAVADEPVFAEATQPTRSPRRRRRERRVAAVPTPRPTQPSRICPQPTPTTSRRSPLSFRSASRPATTPPITRGTRKTRRKSLSRSSLRSSTTVLPSRMPRMRIDAALLPAAVAAAAVTDADDVPDMPDVADEDAPAAAGRFGSRKRKTEKAPKRQGGKGRKVVGLKIGASQLAAAVVTETERGHELVGLARRSLAAGIVVDGEVRDEDALANAVRSFFDEEKLPKGDVRIGLSSNRIGVRTLDIEGVEDESRFDNAVRFKAHEVLPVALSESVLDYRVLEERLTRGRAEDAPCPARRSAAGPGRAVYARCESRRDPARGTRSRGARPAPCIRRTPHRCSDA